MTSSELAAPAAGTRRLHAVTPDERDDRVDRVAAIAAVEDLLTALGRDVDSPHLLETPRRVADAFIEMLTPRPFAATTFPNDDGYDELVVVTDIPFHSLCEHHLLPVPGSRPPRLPPG